MIRPPNLPDRVLLVQLRAMGDVLLCTPAIRQLRRALPNARLDFVAFPPEAAVLARNPWLDRVLPYHHGAAAGLRRTASLALAGYDAVLVFHFHYMVRASALSALVPAKLQAGFLGLERRRWRYTYVLATEPRVQVYHGWSKVELLRAVGVEGDPEDLNLEIFPEERDGAWAEAELARLGLGRARVVALSGVARLQKKAWGAERWARVADALAEAGYDVLLTHGPGEREQAARIAAAARAPVTWDHAPTTVHQMAALLQRCAAWVGNDGGLRHVAVAAGIPTFAVARPDRGAPYTDPRPAAGHRFIESIPAHLDPAGADGGAVAEQIVAWVRSCAPE